MGKKHTTLVIGLGNPILGDDGVGWCVAKKAQDLLNGNNNLTKREIEFDYLSLGGLSLMERMVGYQDVLVVDSILTGAHPIGTIFSLPLSVLPNFSSGHTTAIHDASLQTALDVGRAMGVDLPENIWVVAVETEYVYDFSEELSPQVASVVPHASEIVLEFLESESRQEKIIEAG